MLPFCSQRSPGMIISILQRAFQAFGIRYLWIVNSHRIWLSYRSSGVSNSRPYNIINGERPVLSISGRSTDEKNLRDIPVSWGVFVPHVSTRSSFKCAVYLFSGISFRVVRDCKMFSAKTSEHMLKEIAQKWGATIRYKICWGLRFRRRFRLSFCICLTWELLVSYHDWGEI